MKGQQSEVSSQEREERIAEMRTQGRKGCHSPRINMAVTPENHTYTEIMSKIQGKSMTRFINDCIEFHRSEYQNVYDQAKALLAPRVWTKDDIADAKAVCQLMPGALTVERNVNGVNVWGNDLNNAVSADLTDPLDILPHDCFPSLELGETAELNDIISREEQTQE